MLPNRSRAAGLKPLLPFGLGFPDCFCGGFVGGRRLAARGLSAGGSCRSLHFQVLTGQVGSK